MRLTILITFAVFILILLVIVRWAIRKGRHEIDRNRVEMTDEYNPDTDTEPDSDGPPGPSRYR